MSRFDRRFLSALETARVAAGTCALIAGAAMVSLGTLEALGLKISGDVSPGGSPYVRVLIGASLCVLSLVLRKTKEIGK